MTETTALTQTRMLANGVEIPVLGLGTWFIDDADAAQAVRDAVEIGYRHVDTAQAYGNERGVGEGVRSAAVPREQIFVTTKLAAEVKDHDAAAAAIDESLERMGLDHLDLMLIHSPEPWADFRGGSYDEGNLAAWTALEEAQAAWKIRAIGVSNFREHDLDNLIEHGSVVPQVNQLLAHVGNTPDGLIAYCESHGILVEGYSPVAHGAILGERTVAEVAARYGASVPALCVRYLLQRGLVPLPKTADPEHMRDNAAVDFEISEEDMAALSALRFADYGEDSRFPVFSGK